MVSFPQRNWLNLVRWVKLHHNPSSIAYRIDHKNLLFNRYLAITWLCHIGQAHRQAYRGIPRSPCRTGGQVGDVVVSSTRYSCCELRVPSSLGPWIHSVSSGLMSEEHWVYTIWLIHKSMRFTALLQMAADWNPSMPSYQSLDGFQSASIYKKAVNLMLLWVHQIHNQLTQCSSDTHCVRPDQPVHMPYKAIDEYHDMPDVVTLTDGVIPNQPVHLSYKCGFSPTSYSFFDFCCHHHWNR